MATRQTLTLSFQVRVLVPLHYTKEKQGEAMIRELEKAWEKAREASGVTNKAKEYNYDKFFLVLQEEIGLGKEQIIGLFNEWNRIPHEEAMEIQARWNTSIGFCAYMADRFMKKVGAAGTSTAYTYDFGEIIGEEH